MVKAGPKRKQISRHFQLFLHTGKVGLATPDTPSGASCWGEGMRGASAHGQAEGYRGVEPQQQLVQHPKVTGCQQLDPREANSQQMALLQGKPEPAGTGSSAQGSTHALQGGGPVIHRPQGEGALSRRAGWILPRPRPRAPMVVRRGGGVYGSGSHLVLTVQQTSSPGLACRSGGL